MTSKKESAPNYRIRRLVLDSTTQVRSSNLDKYSAYGNTSAGVASFTTCLVKKNPVTNYKQSQVHF